MIDPKELAQFREYLEKLSPLDRANMEMLIQGRDITYLNGMLDKAKQSGNPYAVVFTSAALILWKIRNAAGPLLAKVKQIQSVQSAEEERRRPMRQFTLDMREMERLYPPVKIIVCGSRTFSKKKLLYRTLDRLTFWFDNVEVVSGGGEGADYLGEEWGRDKWYKVTNFEPKWRDSGKAAGPIRNKEMAKYVGKGGYCVAFWDGRSPGTKSMIQIAKQFGLKVKVVRYM